MICRYIGSILLSILLISCSGVKLSQKIVLSEGDWCMSGNSPEQKNIANIELSPPLYKMWEYDIEAGVGYGGISVADAVVFVNSLAGELFSFDISTGSKLGTLKFLGKDAGTVPLVLGNDIVFTFAGDDKYSAASYNLLEGRLNWQKNYGYIQTSPVYKDGYIYFGTVSGNMVKIVDSTGLSLWKFYCSEPIHTTCAVSGNSLVFGTDKGSFICLNTDKGTENWRLRLNSPVYSIPMIHNETVYFGCDDSNYYAVNLSSGSVKWAMNVKTKIISGSTLFNDSLAVFAGINGTVYALNANNGNLIWDFVTNGTITASPVTSGKYIYITSFDSHIYCLDGSSGTMLWNYEFENKSRTSPVIWKNYLFTSADRSVFCFSNIKNDKEQNSIK